MKPPWVKRQKDGSLVIFPSVCDELGLGPEEAVSLEVVAGELRIRALNRVVEPVQAVFRHHVPQEASRADELIAHRRPEAKTE
jgi:hypothetical protein